MSTALPTDSELEILDLLWRRGPGTVREYMAPSDRDGTWFIRRS